MKRSLSVLTALVIIFTLILCSCGRGGDEPIISIDDLPAYSGAPYVKVNGNEPFFTDDQLTTASFEIYSDLDGFGRCGVATACIGRDIMPTDKREDITSVKPSGWEHDGSSNNIKYDGEYLYNRCHLIGF